MGGEYRYIWRIAFQNFLKSLRSNPIKTSNIGKDYYGNVYFEVPANPSIGKRKPVRWYDPPKGKDFNDPIPAEWESWLRCRRPEPPTEEEIMKNLAIMKMKQENAEILEKKRIAEGGQVPPRPEKGHLSYPRYPEFEEDKDKY